MPKPIFQTFVIDNKYVVQRLHQHFDIPLRFIIWLTCSRIRNAMVAYLRMRIYHLVYKKGEKDRQRTEEFT